MAFSSNSTLEKSVTIDFIAVLDFEATCWEKQEQRPNPKVQEIIEFPTLLVDTSNGEIISEFHEYVKPEVHKHLSKFCTDLTGIQQQTVDLGANLEEVIKKHIAWLRLNDLEVIPGDGGKSFAYLTCGDWDLKTCLPNQLAFYGKKPHVCFHRWINIKHVFTEIIGQKAGGMVGMLKILNLKLEGRHHSGIDDCRNIHQIAQQLLKQGWRPTL